jgi:phage-related minor tail protein
MGVRQEFRAVADNVQDVSLEILKGIQAGIAALDGKIGRVEHQVSELTGRFDQLEAALRKDRRNVAGMLVMMRATAGDFDERVAEIEERVAALEASTQ